MLYIKKIRKMICDGIKENPEITSSGSVVLNVEKYGGMLLAPWFDRPLSLAGRIIVRGKNALKQLLVNIDRDLLLIPNLAIHFNREANDGKKFDVQTELRPIFAMNDESANETSFLSLIAKTAGVKKGDIVSHDLFLYARSEPALWGAKNEFISAPRLDDLECAFTTLQGFISAQRDSSAEPESDTGIPVNIFKRHAHPSFRKIRLDGRRIKNLSFKKHYD